MTDKNSYENQFLSEGVNNPKYVDLLEEDKPIAGQKFCCVSFCVTRKNSKKERTIFLSRIPKTLGFY